jgi:hypothetical protein
VRMRWSLYFVGEPTMGMARELGLVCPLSMS